MYTEKNIRYEYDPSGDIYGTWFFVLKGCATRWHHAAAYRHRGLRDRIVARSSAYPIAMEPVCSSSGGSDKGLEVATIRVFGAVVVGGIVYSS